MRKIYILYLALLTLLLGGCSMPPLFLSSAKHPLTTKEQYAECQDRCRDFQNVKVLSQGDYVELLQAQSDNAFLYRKVAALNQTIEEQKKVVALQETVIRLFDDSNHSMQKNIEEQIAAQHNKNYSVTESSKWTFTNKYLFTAETTLLSANGRKALLKVADALRQDGNATISVSGHADDRPLKPSAKYSDNWALSALRAAAVVEFLHRVGGLAPERLSATGYGYYQPIYSNESATGREGNSRIVISVDEG
ncbi:MAG: OmpA family protein [Desulfuromonas sp.]|nr:OmpA family protein [Desulfuromonas sp.]